jgi:hypothetical protein
LDEYEEVGRIECKRPTWERFAAAHGGRFWITETIDGIWELFHLTIPFMETEIVFVETDNHPLKLSSTLDPTDGFLFTIWPQDFVDGVMHFFGAQDVVIGDVEFDKAFVVKANDERRVKRLLESQEIKSFLLGGSYPSIGAEVFEGKTYLRMTVNRTTETEAELESLLSFFCAVVQRMTERRAQP